MSKKKRKSVRSKGKTRRPKKTPPSNLALIANPLTEQYIQAENYPSVLGDFMLNSEDSQFESVFPKLLMKDKAQNSLNAFSKEMEMFFKLTFLRQEDGLTFNRVLLIYKHIFLNQAELINLFVKHRDSFEQLFLSGKYNEASEALEESKRQLGESIWYLRNKFLLLGYQGSKEIEPFYEEVKERACNPFIDYLLQRFLLIAKSPDAMLNLSQMVISNVKELKKTPISDFANLLSLIFVPDPLIQKDDNFVSIYTFQMFPVIDQYFFILKWIPHACWALRGADDSANVKLIEAFLNEVSFSVDDKIIQNCVHRIKSDNLPSMPNKYAMSTYVTKYETGNYADLIDDFSTDNLKLEDSLALLNLVAKSKAILGSNAPTVRNSPLLDMVEQLSKMYLLSVSEAEMERTINSTIIKLHGLSQSNSIQLLPYKAFPQRYCNSDMKYVATMASFHMTEITPLTKSMMIYGKAIIEPSYLIKDKSRLSSFRKVKDEIKELIKHNALPNLIDEKLSLYRAEAVLNKDYLELASEYYLLSNRMNDLLRLCVESMIENKESHFCFPMHDLIARIENDSIWTLDAVIVAYFYVRMVSSNKTYVLNETFEEYIDSFDKSPLELLQGSGELSGREVLFYKDICMPELLEFLSCYSEVTQPMAERLDIVDCLYKKEIISYELMTLESESIVKKVMIDTGFNQFNTSKIYVNDIAISQICFDNISSLLSLYQHAEEVEDDKYHFLLDKEEEASHAYISGNKNTILLKMIRELSGNFLKNEKYGLDKNLSEEIRHGFFSNLIRSHLEDAHLITQIGEDGKYSSNEHYISHLVFVQPKIQKEIDRDMAWFSESFNNLIAEAEEWMKVTTDNAHPERIFNYYYTEDDFSTLILVADNCNDAQQFIDHFMEFIWGKTEFFLANMRDKLNDEFKSKATRLFDQLLEKLQETKQNVPLTELLEALPIARSALIEDIHIVSDWFMRNQSPESSAHLLEDILQISINCFEQIKGFNSAVELSLSSDVRAITIAGQNINSLIIALFNIFDNCYKHSGLGNETKVEVYDKRANNKYYIYITNNVSLRKSEDLTEEVIQGFRKKMISPDSLGLMRSEGGSGITKVYNHLKGAGSHFNMDINFEGDQFATVISYDI